MNANQSWIAMFRRIPADMQDLLALGLTTGVEVVVQKILKLEPEFMIIRGRMSGSQDTGRILLFPYGELAYVAIQRFMKDPEVEAIFGKGAPPAVAEMPMIDESAGPEAPVEEAPAKDPPAAVAPPKKPEGVSKTALLAKLRERLKDGGQGGK